MADCREDLYSVAEIPETHADLLVITMLNFLMGEEDGK